MPDLDDLLTPEIAVAAGEAARRPSLGSLTARGARRRRIRAGSVLVGAAVAVTAIAMGATQLRLSPQHPSPTPQPPSSTALPTPSTSASGKLGVAAQAKAVVGAPDSKVAALVVAPSSSEHRISEWYTCGGATSCTDGRYALSVTADGYRHATVVALPVTKGYYGIEAGGSNHFVLTLGTHLVGVVDLQGHVQHITVSGRAGPAERGEIVSTLGKHPIAVDPDSGAAHPLALPPGSRYIEDVSGRLWASGGAPRLQWSDDEGASWHPLALPAGAATKTLLPIPSADPSVEGVIRGTYGANTNFQWDSTLRSSSGGTFTLAPAAAPSGSSLASNASAILPDGRLIVLITYWHSWQSGQHSPAAGFYIGSDWSHLERVRMGSPFAELPYTSAPTVLNITSTGQGITIYATTADQSSVFSSTDSGASWHPMAAR